MRSTIALAGLSVLVSLAGCDARPPDAPVTEAHPARLALALTIEGRPVHLELRRNDGFVASGATAWRQVGDRLEQVALAPPAPCYYRGAASFADAAPDGAGRGFAALSTCAGIEGMVVLDGVAFALTRGADLDHARVARAGRDPGPGAVTTVTRRPDEGLATIEAALTPPTRFVELLMVNDRATFNAYGAQTEQRSYAIANMVDALFRNGDLSPSIGIVLTGQITFTSTEPFTWTTTGSGEASSSSLLQSFAGWAAANAAPAGVVPRADTRMLLTGLNLDGPTVGLASVGGMCDPAMGGIVQGTFSDAFVALRVTHELGHMFGMQHDVGASGSPCDASAYIMAGVSCSNCPGAQVGWSACSQAALTTFLETADCLDDVPMSSWGGGRCGDGVVQAGERCDCGDDDCSVNDPCCDGATCQLVAGAECAKLDGCCDQCKITRTERVCRAAESACETAATCNQVSSYCPPNADVAPGTACDDGLTATGGRCYDGECHSLAAQCDALEATFPVDGLVACQFQSLFNSGNACLTLYCGTNNDPTSCVSFTTSSGVLLVDDGTRCASASQCVDQTCVPSSSLAEDASPYTFETGPWSACSTTCGEGTQARIVVCLDAFGRRVSNASCQGSPPPSSQSCNPGPCETYTWTTSDWSPCSEQCDGGVQVRTVACTSSTGQVVPDSLCAAAGPKPEGARECNTQACVTYSWITSDWSPCSEQCDGGVQVRTVACTSSTGQVVPDSLCAAAGPKPEGARECNTQACVTYSWITSDWSPCSEQCDGGVQVRTVACTSSTGQVVPDSLCAAAGPKPEGARECNTQACVTYSWITSDWSPCSEQCDGGVQVRTVACTSSTGQVVPDSLCAAAGPKPEGARECNTQACVTYSWITSDWSPCSEQCDGGVQVRTVACTSSTGQVVPDSLCAAAGPKPEGARECNTQACVTYSWITSDWSPCSEQCDGGVQVRTVACTSSTGEIVPDSLCAAAGPKPEGARECNSDPCSVFAWLVGAFGPCSVACGVGIQSRFVGCVDETYGMSVDESLCAHAGPKPETTIACGPSCAAGYACELGQCAPIDGCLADPCRKSQTCFTTGPGTWECREPSCTDGVHNGRESDVDCGGPCDDCQAGASCRRNRDCASRVCDADMCAAPSCEDGVHNGDESDRDCGGACGATCERHDTCVADADCASDHCDGGRCARPRHCEDGVQSGDETGTDCGGACRRCRR